MFPFASIFTEVPLIIMLTAYMIYFGACALNKSHEKQNDTTLEISDQITDNKNVILAGKQTFTYDDDSVTRKDYTSVNYNENLFNKTYEAFLFYIKDKIVRSPTRTFHLFSRPPPVI
jgi:hypothetical protein